jgi:hypothetical protein
MDEYENIDQKIGQGTFPEDLLATFRKSMQSHRRITWIFAGSHEITELDNAPWTSYFVSARTVEVPLFSEKETRFLLTEPLKHSPLWREDDPGHSRPRFELGFWGEDKIESVHSEAGGWPHLVQLIAETVVDLLNDEASRQVTSLLMERRTHPANLSHGEQKGGGQSGAAGQERRGSIFGDLMLNLFVDALECFLLVGFTRQRTMQGEFRSIPPDSFQSLIKGIATLVLIVAGQSSASRFLLARSSAAWERSIP